MSEIRTFPAFDPEWAGRFISDVRYLTEDHAVCLSTPYPVAVAEVLRAGDLWTCQLTSVMTAPRSRYATRESGVSAGVRLALRVALTDWRARYTGPQRYAIGHQQCPYASPSGLCRQRPDGWSIWCDWHPYGRRRQL